MSSNFTIPEDFCGDAPSSNSTQIEFWALKQSGYGVATACVMLLYLLLGLPWNCLVAGVILRQKLYRQPTIVLLLNLVLSDILILLTIVPLNMVTGFAGEFVLGNSDRMRCQVCKTGLIITWFSLMSLCSITLMAADRFVYIYKPFHYERMITPFRVSLVLACVWMLCIVIAILPLFGFGSIGFYRPFVSCTVDFTISSNYYLVILIAVACMPLIILIICNIWVVYIVQKNIKVIYRYRRSLVSLRQRRSHRNKLRKVVKRRRQKKQLHLTRVFGSLLFANLISWLPLIIVAISSFAVPLDDIPPAILVLVNVFFMAQVLVHPALETALISDVKEPIKEIFEKCMCFKVKKKCCVSSSDGSKHDSCFARCNRVDKSEESTSNGGCGFLEVLCIALLPHELNMESTDTVEDGMTQTGPSLPGVELSVPPIEAVTDL